MQRENVTTSPGKEYFNNYIKLVNGNDIVPILEQQGLMTKTFFNAMDEAKGDYRYAAGKWTVKEVVGHLSDAERIFAYRALRFARKDKTRLSPFEQDDYVNAANFNARSLRDLASELFAIRQSNLALFKTFSDQEMHYTGTSGNAELSVKDLLYIIAGHEIHHMKVLQERYI